MLLKVALVALVFVAVHGQPIDNPEDRVANKPVARPRRGVAEELMKNLDLMARPLGPTNGRQRRSDDEVAEVDAELKRITEELWTLLLWGNRDETKRRVKEVRGELNALLQKLDAGTHGEYSDKIKEVISVLDAVTENIDRSL